MSQYRLLHFGQTAGFFGVRGYHEPPQRVQCNGSITGTFDEFSISFILIGNYPKVFKHSDISKIIEWNANENDLMKLSRELHNFVSLIGMPNAVDTLASGVTNPVYPPRSSQYSKRSLTGSNMESGISPTIL